MSIILTGDLSLVAACARRLSSGVRLLSSVEMAFDETWFYDNALDPDDAAPPLLRVERVYCLNFDAFSEADWERLAEIYRTLPHWLGYDCDGCPCWFGSDEEKPPYLWASVEPAGLQVHGVLLGSDWEAWDSEFRKLGAAVPKRELG